MQKDGENDMKNCDINISMEELQQKLSPTMILKVNHSIEVIRRADALRKKYYPDVNLTLAFSGGKDSQALYHVAKLSGVSFKPFMSLTSVDPAEVIRFVRTEYPDVKTIKPCMSIYDMAFKVYGLPMRHSRWCCSKYKEKYGGRMTLTGIRKQESVNRSKREEVDISDYKFKGTFDELDNYRKTRKDQFDEHEESEISCMQGSDSMTINPIIYWSESDVWSFLNSIRAKHCVLYDNGQKRIGCIFCPMAKKSEKRYYERKYPRLKQKWIQTIERIKKYQLSRYEELTTKGKISWSLYSDEIWRWWLSGIGICDWIEKYRAKQRQISFFSCDFLHPLPDKEFLNKEHKLIMKAREEDAIKKEKSARKKKDYQ